MSAGKPFVFAGRVYRPLPPPSPPPTLATQHSLTTEAYELLQRLSPEQREAASLGLTALCLVCGFWLVVRLQQSSPPTPSQRNEIKLYSSGAPVYRCFFFASPGSTQVHLHPVLAPPQEEISFSAELEQLGMRLSELVRSNDDGEKSVAVETKEEFERATRALLGHRHGNLLRAFKTYNFDAFPQHPLVWAAASEGDDLLIRASCAIPLLDGDAPPPLLGETTARQVACLQRAMQRRYYDQVLLRVLFAGLLRNNSTGKTLSTHAFEDLIEPSAHTWMRLERGIWQKFLLSTESGFSSSSPIHKLGRKNAAAVLSEFERAVKLVSPTLSWAVVDEFGEKLFGDRGFSLLARYDVILDQKHARLYFNLCTVQASERRDLVCLLNGNLQECALQKGAGEMTIIPFASHKWTLCSKLPESGDRALHVVGNFAEAKKLHASKPQADVAIIVDGTILTLQL